MLGSAVNKQINTPAPKGNPSGILIRESLTSVLGVFQITRSGPKWHFNKNGILVTAADGEAGFGPNGLTIDPARTNLLDSGLHRDFANWGTVNAVVAANQNGIDSSANAARTVEDDNAAGIERCIEGGITIPDDSSNYALTGHINKDSDETRFPESRLSLAGGSSSQTEYIRLNTASGATHEVAPEGSIRVRQITAGGAERWLLDQRLSNNSTGNTSLALWLYPAMSTSIDGVNENAAVGSIIADWWTVVNALFVGRPIPGATTRNADVVSGTMPSQFGSSAGVIGFDLTPFAAALGVWSALTSYVDANNYTGILHDGSNLIARRRVGGVNHDATIAHSYTPGQTDRVYGRFNDDHCSIFLNGAKGTDNTDTVTLQKAADFKLNDGADAAIGSWEIQNFVMAEGARFDNDSAVTQLA